MRYRMIMCPQRWQARMDIGIWIHWLMGRWGKGYMYSKR